MKYKLLLLLLLSKQSYFRASSIPIRDLLEGRILRAEIAKAEIERSEGIGRSRVTSNENSDRDRIERCEKTNKARILRAEIAKAKIQKDPETYEEISDRKFEARQLLNSFMRSRAVCLELSKSDKGIKECQYFHSYDDQGNYQAFPSTKIESTKDDEGRDVKIFKDVLKCADPNCPRRAYSQLLAAFCLLQSHLKVRCLSDKQLAEQGLSSLEIARIKFIIEKLPPTDIFLDRDYNIHGLPVWLESIPNLKIVVACDRERPAGFSEKELLNRWGVKSS